MDDSLRTLLAENPIYIPVTDAATFLHMAPSALRASIDQGRCPFGFSWKLGERSGYKIPSATFVAWYTKGLSLDRLTV